MSHMDENAMEMDNMDGRESDVRRRSVGDTQVYREGSKVPVRCPECGANIFRPHAAGQYSCNGCDAILYLGK